MVVRLAFFCLMALGLAGFGTVAWIATRPSDPSTDQLAALAVKIKVLTAARAVHAGALLKPDDLASVEIAPEDKSADATIDSVESRTALLGAMMRRSLNPGEEVHAADLLRPGDRGFLAAVLQPGTRAITVAVDSVTGSAGLIWPGDHVDLILTQTLANDLAPAGRRVAAETALSDVRVIAIDQQIVEGADATSRATQARTITLEVSPEQAERVSVAVRLGRLSLVVRAASPAGGEQLADGFSGAGATTTTWADDVSPALRGGSPVPTSADSVATAPAPVAAAPMNPSMRIFSGAADGKEYHF